MTNSAQHNSRFRISRRLRIFFAMASMLFVAHGMEEYLAGFYDVDLVFRWLFARVEGMSAYQASFLVFQLSLWTTLVLFSVSLLGTKWQLRLIAVSGLFQIIEIRHIVVAVASGHYYPGLYSAIALAGFSYFFWKELLANFRVARSR